MRVKDVIEALRKASSNAWQDAPWDGLQAGSMEAAVTGVAVAWSPEISVLREAKARGCNLLLVKDPLYWFESSTPGSTRDSIPRVTEGSAGATSWSVVEGTSLYKLKKELVESSGLNVVRVAQNWDGASSRSLHGLLKALRWSEGKSFVADDHTPQVKTSVVEVPARTLVELAGYARDRTGGKSVRVLGERSAMVRRVAVHPAYLTVEAATRIGQAAGVDAVITGEGCEWESFEYFEDWIDSGRGKGLIMLGLAVVSDTAAAEFAQWVRGVVGPVRVEFLPVGDPFTPVHAGGLRA